MASLKECCGVWIEKVEVANKDVEKWEKKIEERRALVKQTTEDITRVNDAFQSGEGLSDSQLAEKMGTLVSDLSWRSQILNDAMQSQKSALEDRDFNVKQHTKCTDEEWNNKVRCDPGYAFYRKECCPEQDDQPDQPDSNGHPPDPDQDHVITWAWECSDYPVGTDCTPITDPGGTGSFGGRFGADDGGIVPPEWSEVADCPAAGPTPNFPDTPCTFAPNNPWYDSHYHDTSVPGIYPGPPPSQLWWWSEAQSEWLRR